MASLSLDLSEVRGAVVNELIVNKSRWIGEVSDLPTVVENLRKFPMMRVISGAKIVELGRIPLWNEVDADNLPYSVRLDDLLASWEPHDDLTKIVLAYLSYTPSAQATADDADNSKAFTVRMLTNYSSALSKTDKYWWIDFACRGTDVTAEGT